MSFSKVRRLEPCSQSLARRALLYPQKDIMMFLRIQEFLTMFDHGELTERDLGGCLLVYELANPYWQKH